MIAVRNNLGLPKSLPRLSDHASGYAVFVLTVSVIFASSLTEMAYQWASSSSYRHGVIVPFSVLWLISSGRLGGAQYRTAFSAIPLIAIFAFVWLFAEAAQIALLAQIAFVGAMISGVALCFGFPAFRRWLPALLLLFFMVPAGDQIVPALQAITAKIVAALFSMMSAPVVIDGNLITTKAGYFEIAAACAGLNFLLASMFVASVFSIGFIAHWRDRISFMAIALASAIAANALRAFSLVLIATLSNKTLATGIDHLFFGWFIYVAALAFLIWIGARFTRKVIAADDAGPGNSARRYGPIAAGIMIVALAGLYKSNIEGSLSPADTALPQISLENWRKTLAPVNYAPYTPFADQLDAFSHSDGNKSVYVYVAGYYGTDKRSEAVSHNNRAADGEIWREIGRDKLSIAGLDHIEFADVHYLAGPERRRLAVAKIFWSDDRFFDTGARLKFAQGVNALQRKAITSGAIYVGVVYDNDRKAAMDELSSYLNAAAIVFDHND